MWLKVNALRQNASQHTTCRAARDGRRLRSVAGKARHYDAGGAAFFEKFQKLFREKPRVGAYRAQFPPCRWEGEGFAQKMGDSPTGAGVASPQPGMKNAMGFA
jgi:hypothetical protein